MLGIYLALALFAATNFAMAIYRRPKSEYDFLIKERRVRKWEMAAATFTLIGGGEFVTLTTLAHYYGPWAIVYFVGILAGFILLAVCVASIRSKAEARDLHSLPDYFYYHFGSVASICATALTFLALGALLIIQFIVGGLAIGALTQTSPAIWSIAMALLVIAYLWATGFRGVLATDYVQAAVMAIMLVVLAVAVSVMPRTMVQSQPAPAPSPIAGSIPLSDAISLIILGACAVLGGSDVWQRVYASEKDSDARGGLIRSAVGWLLFGIILTWLAVSIRSVAPDLNAENAFVEFVTKRLPVWAGPLVSLLVLSAVMSTADVELFLISVVVNKEIARFKKGKATQAQTRALIIAVGIVAALIAVFLSNLILIYFFILYLLAAVGPVAFARALGRGNTTTAVLGMVGGTLAIVALAYSNHLRGWASLIMIVPSLPAFFVSAKGRETPNVETTDGVHSAAG